jgi:hypothetical protein
MSNIRCDKNELAIDDKLTQYLEPTGPVGGFGVVAVVDQPSKNYKTLDSGGK